MAKPIIDDVSDTALWVATYRADETERPDALFRDPLARRLAGEKGRKIASVMKASRYTRWAIVTRTCIIDAYIRELVPSQVDTVINLGAGLDTRPYRMGLPSSVRWIEIDFPHMIEFKNKSLSGETPTCRLERIGLDLSNVSARKKVLSEISSSSRNVLVLTEGVTPYLTSEQVQSLATDLRSNQNFAFWILDYFAPEVQRYLKRLRGRGQMKNAPFQFFPDDWFGFFGNCGWKSREMRYTGLESLKLGRAIPVPWLFRIAKFFISREKLKQSAKFTGYALLEPK